jgi:transcriptional antiterminator RfaH
MQHWYTLHAKPHKERQVEAVLAARGIEVYFPTVPAPRRNNRAAQNAFFPCYLFAHVDLDVIGLWPLHYAPGVRRVVMFGGLPARVDDGIIETLRARLSCADAVYANGAVLKRGDRVVITSGPFADVEAVFDRRLSPAGRVRVLIDWLKRSIPVEVDSIVLRKTSGA